MLASHQNRTVRLIGKVVQVSADGTRVQIESADGGIVNVTRSLVSIEEYFNVNVLIYLAPSISRFQGK